MEIKNNLTVTNGERGGRQQGKEGEWLRKGTCIKDPRRGELNVGEGQWAGHGRAMGEIWEQL